MAVIGTLNWRLQKVQIPIAGVVPSHLVTRRLPFGIVSFVGDGLAGGFLLCGSVL